jgi:hypothetical protein
MFTAITVMLLLIAINYFHATHKCNMFTAITVMLLLSFQNKKNKMTIKKIIQDQEKIITWFSICPQV